MTLSSTEPFYERRAGQDGVIIEWTLDGNLYITSSRWYGVSWRSVDVEDRVADLTEIDAEHVEECLIEPLQDAGFKVEYESEPEPEPGIIRRILTFLYP